MPLRIVGFEPVAPAAPASAPPRRLSIVAVEPLDAPEAPRAMPEPRMMASHAPTRPGSPPAGAGAGAVPAAGVDEPAFQRWYASRASRQGLDPNPDGQFYDYRAAFRAGAEPGPDGHWPSQFKQDGHPNTVVGGFDTRTGKRVPGTPQASAQELERLGWEPSAAATLSGAPTMGDLLGKATGISRGDPERTPWRMLTEAPARVLRNIAQGFETQFEAGAWNAIAGVAENLGLDTVAQFYKSAADDAKGLGERVGPSPAGLGFGESAVYSGVQSIGGAAPSLAAGAVAGPAASLVLMGATTGGNSYAEARKQGLSPERAALYGVVDGVIEAATERIPATKLLDDVLKGSGVMKTVLSQLKEEIPNEQFAELGQSLNAWLSLPENADKPFAAYVADRPSAAAQTFIATLTATVGQSGGAVALARLAQPKTSADVVREGVGGAAAEEIAHEAVLSATRPPVAEPPLQEPRGAARPPGPSPAVGGSATGAPARGLSPEQHTTLTRLGYDPTTLTMVDAQEILRSGAAPVTTPMPNAVPEAPMSAEALARTKREVEANPALRARRDAMMAEAEKAQGEKLARPRGGEVEEEPAREFSSTQVDLPAEAADGVREMAARIPDEDLTNDGRETTPHITVQYGIDSDDAAPLREALAGIGPITATLGKTSLFENDDADVVKVDIDSPDLRRVREAIATVIDAPGDTRGDYVPHATVAYVKPGQGQKYAGDATLEGQTIAVDRIAFTTRDGQTIEIPLGEATSAQADPWAAVPPTVRRQVESHLKRIDDALYAIDENTRIKGPQHGDLEREQQRGNLTYGLKKLADFRRMAEAKGIDVAPMIGEAERRATEALGRAADQGTPAATIPTSAPVDTAPPPAQTGTRAATRPEATAREGAPGDAGTARPADGPPRRRDTTRARAARDVHPNPDRAPLFAATLEAARALKPDVDTDVVRREFDARHDLVDDIRDEEDLAGADPRLLLREIAKRGGIFEKDDGMGQAGELRRLREGQAFGKVGGVNGVLAGKARQLRNVAKRIDGKLEIRKEMRGGLPLDVILQDLQADGRFPWLESIDDLTNFLDDVQKHGVPDTGVGLSDLGIRPNTAWWETPVGPQAEVEADTPDDDALDDTFNPAVYEPRPLSTESIRDAFGLTDEQAEATLALADAMGLPLERIEVVQGGEAEGETLPQAGLRTDTPAFRRFFGVSKVTDEHGRPLVVYHGTRRLDRVGARFIKGRATSGPLPFFTDSQDLASKYAESKADTSLVAPEDYSGWFLMKLKGQRTPVDISRAWYFLSPEQRAEVATTLPHVSNLDAEGNEIDGYHVDPDDYGLAGKDHWDWTIREKRGNVLAAAVDVWLNSAGLFGNEQEFLDILALAGLKDVTFEHPHADRAGVLPVYLSIKNPLDTSAVPATVVSALERRAARQRAPRREDSSGDIWDKRNQMPREWVAQLKADLATGANSHVWTSIPDWVTDTLEALGYDGIRDRSGKSGTSEEHSVWIPFEPTQIKSAIGNRGTFDPDSSNILKQGEPVVDKTTAGDQPRLPGDVGQVREEERPTPKLSDIEDEFRLTPQFEKRKAKQTTLFQMAGADWWYDNVQEAMKTWQAKGTPEQVLAHLKKTKGALEEAKDTGLTDWLAGQRSVTRDAVLQYAREHAVALTEKTLGAPANAMDIQKLADELWEAEVERLVETRDITRAEAKAQLDRQDFYAQADEQLTGGGTAQYADYQLDGPKENYREILLSLPSKAQKFDKSKVAIKRNRRSTTQGSVQLSYDGKPLGQEYRDEVWAPTSAGWMQPDEYWIGVARSLYEKGETGPVKGLPPGSGDYMPPHFNTPNLLLHVRVNVRTLADGRRVLFAEEMQSDWHQEGRRKGYKTPVAAPTAEGLAKRKEVFDRYTERLAAVDSDILNGTNGARERRRRLETQRDREADAAYTLPADANTRKAASAVQKDGYWEVTDNFGNFLSNVYDSEVDPENGAESAVEMAQRRIRPGNEHRTASDTRVPDAPFKDAGWKKLALKRLLAMATDEGLDGIAWTTGAQQVDRYSEAMRQQVDRISWVEFEAGDQPLKHVRAVKNGRDVFNGVVKGGKFTDGPAAGKSVEDVLGKEVAAKIDDDVAGDLKGDGLTVGGEGMKGFYDRELVNLANDLAKRYGQRVEKGAAVTNDALTPTQQSVWRGRWGIHDPITNDLWMDPRTTQEPTFDTREEAVAAISAMGQSGVGGQAPVHVLATPAEMREAIQKYRLPLYQGKRTRTLAAQNAKASVELTTSGKALIRALTDPDVSSPFHELAHVAHAWLLNRDIAPEARRGITDADIDTVEDWLGVERGAGWDAIPVPAKEKFARGFERYLHDGAAPSTPTKMHGIFGKIRDWMTDIYQTVKGSAIDVEITPAMRNVFDRLVTRKERLAAEATAAAPKSSGPPMAPPLDIPANRPYLRADMKPSEMMWAYVDATWGSRHAQGDLVEAVVTAAGRSDFAPGQPRPRKAPPTKITGRQQKENVLRWMEWNDAKLEEHKAEQAAAAAPKPSGPPRAAKAGETAQTKADRERLDGESLEMLYHTLGSSTILARNQRRQGRYQDAKETDYYVKIVREAYEAKGGDLARIKEKSGDATPETPKPSGPPRTGPITDHDEFVAFNLAQGRQTILKDLHRMGVKQGTAKATDEELAEMLWKATRPTAALAKKNGPPRRTEAPPPVGHFVAHRLVVNGKRVGSITGRITQRGRVKVLAAQLPGVVEMAVKIGDIVAYDPATWATVPEKDWPGIWEDGERLEAPSAKARDIADDGRPAKALGAIDAPPTDTLDTGEEQTRLPGDVGSVRDEERAQPTEDVPEQSLSLSSQQIEPEQAGLGLDPIAGIERAAKKRIKDRGQTDVLFQSGQRALPAEDRDDMLVIAAAKVARGRDRATFDREMTREFGADLPLADLFTEGTARAKTLAALDIDDYFNFKRIAVSDPEKAQLRGAITETVIRTGRVPKERESWATIRQQAADLHPDAVKQLAPFQAMQAPFRAVRDAARRRINVLNLELIEARRAMEGVPQEDALAREAVIEAKERDLQGLLDTWMRMRSEDGRNLAMHRMTVDSLETWYDATFWMSKAKRELGLPSGTDLPIDVMRALQDILNRGRHAVETGVDPEPFQLELTGFITKLRRSSLLETLTALRKAGLLTGPKTHMRNVLGNAAFQVLEETMRVPAVLVDLALSAATGRRTVHGVSPRAIAAASMQAATKGVKQAAEVMRTGVTKDDAKRYDGRGELNSGIRWVDAYVNFVFRTMSASDRIFKSYAFRRSMEEQAALEAINRGVSPIELLAKPPAAMLARAIADAEFATFNNPNQVAQGLQRFKSALSPTGRFVVDMAVPFSNTPSNIVARMIEYTPVGLTGAVGRAAVARSVNGAMTAEQQRVFSMAIGRGLTGSALLYLGWTLAAAGLATGLGGDDEGDRNVRDAAGMLSGAIKIGNRWHQTATFSPAGNLVALGASMQRTASKPFRQETQRIGKMAAIGAGLVLEQPMLKGMSDVLDALQRPESRGEALVGSVAGSFVPTFVNDIASAFDPYRRTARAEGFKDSLWTGAAARFPGLRHRLPARLTVFGEPQAQTTRAIWDPTIATVARDMSDQVLRELVKHDVGIGWPQKRSGESADDFRARTIVTGQSIRERLTQVVESPNYRDMDAERQIGMLEDAIRAARDRVRKMPQESDERYRMRIDRMRPRFQMQ